VAERRDHIQLDTTPVSEGEACATTILAVQGMTCASCARRVERALGRVPGVRKEGHGQSGDGA
jgi:hypothetical protein